MVWAVFSKFVVQSNFLANYVHYEFGINILFSIKINCLLFLILITCLRVNIYALTLSIIFKLYENKSLIPSDVLLAAYSVAHVVGKILFNCPGLHFD